ncbi:MAG: phosphatase [Rhodobacteraceae bacterium]|nr:phosphatase [Paracoccaceae bacterium]
MQINGIIFDKDGTLFGYSKTWDTWSLKIIEKLSKGELRLARELAKAIGFDLENGKLLPQSIVIAGTSGEVALQLGRLLPTWQLDALEQFLNQQVIELPLYEVIPLKEYFELLRKNRLKVGVMTNDSEENARLHLGQVKVNPHCDLDFLAGYDTGYGAKPSAGPLLAFAQVTHIEPSKIVMVGDSLHDLIAGRRAGIKTIGVLTGPANKIDLVDHADIVLPDISHIPKFLEQFRF